MNTENTLPDELFNFYIDLPRQGPGLKEITLQALKYVINELPEYSNVLDVGCGTGAQSQILAENISGELIVVDIYQPYIDKTLNKIQTISSQTIVTGLKKSMNQLSFPEETFNLIWSEGAIYIMGLEEGLNAWQKFLKPKGFIAVSEISWFDDNPPGKILDYFKSCYGAIKSVDKNITLIENTDLEVIGHFSLPVECWWKDYYNPLIKKINRINKKSTIDKETRMLIEESLEEITMFREFSDYYGYEFYITRKK